LVVRSNTCVLAKESGGSHSELTALDGTAEQGRKVSCGRERYRICHSLRRGDGISRLNLPRSVPAVPPFRPPLTCLYFPPSSLCPFSHIAHSTPIRSLSFTSSLLITGSDDKRINVFDLRALASGLSSGGGSGSRKGQVASLGGHEGWVVCVEARNERLLASG
jgi:WD40 repeat protein